jgi:glyoxylase-like metal-dependent hydrolase (beta-lactamase superfamily II)
MTVIASSLTEKIASPKPSRSSRVILTHHHTDHALGAGYFAAKGAALVARLR